MMATKAFINLALELIYQCGAWDCKAHQGSFCVRVSAAKKEPYTFRPSQVPMEKDWNRHFLSKRNSLLSAWWLIIFPGA